MRLRPFRDEDADALVALWQACDLTRPWNPPHDDIALCRQSGHGEIFLAEAAEGDIVGSIMVGHDGHRGWVYYVAVAPARQRAGLGRRLVALAENWLAERGVPKAMLIVREANTAVVAFYTKLGYAVEPRVLMSKRLREAPMSEAQ
jgi:ribosomal protein S18 acetylase RimI-like enzyme